jgi:hypothetical protein
MSERLAILIGNGRFEVDRSLPELFGPRHDVGSLGRLLSDPEVGNFVVFEIIDRDSEQLLAELEPLFAMGRPDSTVLVYYAGYVLSEPGRGLFVATADTEMAAVNDSAVSLSSIKSLLRSCSARDVTVVLDCCYVSPVGSIDEANVEHELRRVRTDVSLDLHLIASPAATRTPHDREVAADSGLEGRLTRCIVEGLSTGAADRAGDNTTTTSELNEYLGMRLGEHRPLWAGPVEGADPEIVATPNPIEGVDLVDYDAVEEVRQGLRRWVLVAAGVAVVLALVIVGAALTRDSGARPVTRLDDYFAGPGLPELVGRVQDLATLRAMIDRTGWVEHTEPLDARGPRYPTALSFRLDPGNTDRPGTVDLSLRQWAQVEFSEGIYGLGVRCADGLNVAEVVVELIDGRQYVFDVRTDTPGQEFFGVVSRMPINRLCVTSMSARFAAAQLYVYADREHERVVEGGP